MGETRKIAAILAADVVGYSRLAGAVGHCVGESDIVTRLRRLRDKYDPDGLFQGHFR
jgi:hypothetical protein